MHDTVPRAGEIENLPHQADAALWCVFYVGCMDNETNPESTGGAAKGTGIAIGVALGLAVGAAVGIAADNLALWLAVGVAIGIACGAAFDARGRRKN